MVRPQTAERRRGSSLCMPLHDSPSLVVCALFCTGHQWRHFGAKYVDCHTDYTGQGVDQLAQVIHTIKTNPNDRRIIMSAWNPTDLNLMALPP